MGHVMLMNHRGGSVTEGMIDNQKSTAVQSLSIPDLVGKNHWVLFAMTRFDGGSGGARVAGVYYVEYHNGVYVANCWCDGVYLGASSNSVVLNASGELAITGKLSVSGIDYTLYFAYSELKYIAW